LVLLRHLSVYLKHFPIEFGKMVNDDIGLSPRQLHELVRDAGQKMDEIAAAAKSTDSAKK